VLHRGRTKTADLASTCSTAFVVSQFQTDASRWQSIDDLKTCLKDAGLDLSDDGRSWPRPEGKPTCMDCWVDNILTDTVLCQDECIKRFLKPKEQLPFEDDACLQCDEYTAGPAFIQCSGLSRRSAGIFSDISREAAYMCPSAHYSLPGPLPLTRPGGECPGVELARTCFNGICESDAGETLDTCPIDCEQALVKSYNGVTRCTTVKALHTPASVEGLQALLRDESDPAQAIGYSERVRHLKVIGGRGSVSTSICTVGTVISTQALSAIIGLESTGAGETAVRVEAGVSMDSLNEWLSQQLPPLTLGYRTPLYSKSTVSGAVATGSHGSSSMHEASLSSGVLALQLIDSRGHLTNYSRDSTPSKLWKALTVHAGQLGIISQLVLKVQPDFNLAANVDVFDDVALLNTGKNGVSAAFELVGNCDFSQLHWFPSTQKVVRLCAVEVSRAAEGDARNSFLTTTAADFGIATPSAVNHIFQAAACDRNIAAAVESGRCKSVAATYLNNGTHRVSSVVGESRHILSSEPSNDTFSAINVDLSVAVPQQHVGDALALASTLLQDKYGASLIQVGALLRFVKIDSSSLLGFNAAGGPFTNGDVAVIFEMPITQPVFYEASDWQKWYRQPYYELVQTLISKFGARCHLGKNGERQFLAQREAKVYGQSLISFQSAVDKLDKERVFQNNFSALLGLY